MKTCWPHVLKLSPSLMPLLYCPGGADLSLSFHKSTVYPEGRGCALLYRQANLGWDEVGPFITAVWTLPVLWPCTSKNQSSHRLSIKVMSKTQQAIQRKLGIFRTETERSESLRLSCKEISSTLF